MEEIARLPVLALPDGPELTPREPDRGGSPRTAPVRRRALSLRTVLGDPTIVALAVIAAGVWGAVAWRDRAHPGRSVAAERLASRPVTLSPARTKP